MFSVIIPTYNRKDFLVRALNSLQKQTFKEFEVIIIDDNSTDGTQDAIKTFKKLKIIYLQNFSNGVVANSRNKGIKRANEEYIAFLDSDDWWVPNKLKLVERNIKHKNYDFLFHDMKIIYEDKKNFFYNKTVPQKPFFENLLLYGNRIYNSSVVIRKQLLIETNLISEDPEIIASEDMHTWAKILKLNPKAKFLDLKLGYYFIHPNSISKKKMYRPTSKVCYEYSKYLTINLKQKVFSRLLYIKYKFFLDNKEKVKYSYLLYILKNGHFDLKIRVILLILKNIFLKNEKKK